MAGQLQRQWRIEQPEGAVQRVGQRFGALRRLQRVAPGIGGLGPVVGGGTGVAHLLAAQPRRQQVQQPGVVGGGAAGLREQRGAGGGLFGGVGRQQRHRDHRRFERQAAELFAQQVEDLRRLPDPQVPSGLNGRLVNIT